ncbi:hypothetical protein POM88_027330 [Heracleum sosnowskyi]|uniref:RNA-binding protein n=1 Tax=Heracleum sosnowskyi TaxID=360622 RepID=A0AAD8I7R2_9APIA|nr:hypothetical protein POM88_027330 [Heracleum sosnowskyi]
MVDTEEGFDDEDKLLRTVFVGNLPLKVKKKALLKEFSQFALRIRSVPIMDVLECGEEELIYKEMLLILLKLSSLWNLMVSFLHFFRISILGSDESGCIEIHLEDREVRTLLGTRAEALYKEVFKLFP